jgi:tetratricopeptide (TPR) repeat protein
MQRLIYGFLVATVLHASLFAESNPAQSGEKKAAADPTASTQKGIELAEGGHCREALTILRKSVPLTSDKQLKLKGGLSTVRCALLLNEFEATVNALAWLSRDFPSDPDVLYVTTHALSDLSTRAALRLATTAPLSTPARKLNAEALESQGKWDEAAAEYNLLLKAQPDLPGIHYRLGRIILSKPPTADTPAEARKEFEAELKIDPTNAGAEYILGELSRQAQQWDDAVAHFSRASKLDATLADAFLGLGFSLNSLGRYAEATHPLEVEVSLQPGNPTGHYQLALAYRQTGRPQDADREMGLFQQTSQRALKEITGRPPQPQTDH